MPAAMGYSDREGNNATARQSLESRSTDQLIEMAA